MRRRFSINARTFGVALLACTTLSAPASHAGEAETPDSLLQEGAKLTKDCHEPKQNWPKKKVSSNYDLCNDALQAFLKAIELSKKNAKTVEAASPALTAANLNMAASALYIGRHYTESENREAALGYFRVACTPFEPASPFAKPTPQQVAAMTTIVADAEEALQGFHRSCKSVAAEQ